MILPVYTIEGEMKEGIEVPDSLFNITLKNEVIHRVVVAHEANGRQVVAHVKTRGQVRGGGKKPWKQKGTGRARQGSIRSPQWRGGGIVFGPNADQNFSKKINKKEKQLAMRMVLSEKARNNDIVIVEGLDKMEPKTSQFAKMMSKIEKVSGKHITTKHVILLIARGADNIKRASRNIPKVITQSISGLNIMEVIKAKVMLIDKTAIEVLQAQVKK